MTNWNLFQDDRGDNGIVRWQVNYAPKPGGGSEVFRFIIHRHNAGVACGNRRVLDDERGIEQASDQDFEFFKDAGGTLFAVGRNRGEVRTKAHPQTLSSFVQTTNSQIRNKPA